MGSDPGKPSVPPQSALLALFGGLTALEERGFKVFARRPELGLGWIGLASTLILNRRALSGPANQTQTQGLELHFAFSLQFRPWLERKNTGCCIQAQLAPLDAGRAVQCQAAASPHFSFHLAGSAPSHFD